MMGPWGTVDTGSPGRVAPIDATCPHSVQERPPAHRSRVAVPHDDGGPIAIVSRRETVAKEAGPTDDCGHPSQTPRFSAPDPDTT